MRTGIAAALCVLPFLASAQVPELPDSLNIRGRNILSGAVGLTGTRDAAATSTQASARATGQVASLSFTHFVRASLGVEVAAAVLDAEASAQATSASADAITALLLGLNY